jgi:ABC-type uncharacterized transport systems, ATPase components
MEKIPLLEMKGITKRVENVLANDSIDLKLYPVELHALLGENGSGKSTLMNILLGIYKVNVGAFYFNGEKVSIKNPKHAVAGILQRMRPKKESISDFPLFQRTG